MNSTNKWFLTDEEKDKFIATLTPNLTILRTSAEISQEELANLIGVSRQTYSAIERKVRKMAYIVKMLDAHIAMRKDYALYLRIYADTFLNKAISPSDYQYERNESLSDDELLYYNEIQEILKSINAQMSKHEIDHCKGIVI